MSTPDWSAATALVDKLAALPADEHDLRVMLIHHAYFKQTDYYTRLQNHDLVPVVFESGKWWLAEQEGNIEVSADKVIPHTYVKPKDAPPIVFSSANWADLAGHWSAMTVGHDLKAMNRVDMLLLSGKQMTGALLAPNWSGRAVGEQGAVPLNKAEVDALYGLYVLAINALADKEMSYERLPTVIGILHPTQFSSAP